MNQAPQVAVVLAAGQGKRMGQKDAKVLVPLAGKPMLAYVLDHLQSADCNTVVIVVGYGREKIESWLRASYGESVVTGTNTVSRQNNSSLLQIYLAVQETQVGTADALLAAEPVLVDYAGDVLVMCGDMPLISGNNLGNFFAFHRESSQSSQSSASQSSASQSSASQSQSISISVLSANVSNPTGYGRLIRNESGELERIIEEKDATVKQRQIREVNSGTYIVQSPRIFTYLREIGNKNQQAEFYLTDLVDMYYHSGNQVGAYRLADEDALQIQGINTTAEKEQAEKNLAKMAQEKMAQEETCKEKRIPN